MMYQRLLRVVLSVLLLSSFIRGKGDDVDESEYLYHDEDSSIIYDYEPDPEQGDHPKLIYDPSEGPRVIEFYAPWCPHCRHFQRHYVALAEQVTAVLKENQYDGPEVKFCAVSCTVNKKICRDMGVHGYPKIRLFPAGATGPDEAIAVEYWKLHPFDTLNALGVHVDTLRLDDAEQFSAEVPSKSASGFGESITRHFRGRAKTATDQQLALGWPPRTKQQVFDDAYLSFDFNLRQGIFTTEGPLSNSTQTALRDWLQLLKKTTPVVWKIHKVINALLDKFDRAVESEDNLLAIIDEVAPTPKQKTWSDACTKGESGMGYTCGLWELFHIVTVGLVEYNMMIAGDDDIVLKEISLSTVKGAETLRNFVDNFFGCEVCRVNFVAAFDSCAHDRCTRLTESDMSPKQWILFPVWLFETHNSVNARLLREKADRENRVATPEEEVSRQWPSKQQCPKCWTDSGGWDEEVVYKYMRVEYWSEDFVSSQYREDTGANQKFQEDDEHLSRFSLLTQGVPLGVVLLLAFTWYTQKLKRVKTGRHKKIDDPLGCPTL